MAKSKVRCKRLWRELDASLRLADELDYEFHRRQADKALESMMDCRKIEKSFGTHGKIENPIRQKIVPEISVSRAALMCRSGGTIRHDERQQVRYVIFNGKIVGRIHHGDFLKLCKEIIMRPCRIPGTNFVEYRAV